MLIEKLQLDSNNKPVRNARGTLVMDDVIVYKGSSLEVALMKHFPGCHAVRGEADSPLDLVVYQGSSLKPGAFVGLISLSIAEYEHCFQEEPNFGDSPVVY